MRPTAHPLAIVLSDVLVGNNDNTVWYQKPIHEQYLVTALNCVVDFESRQSGVIQEVVLLGDLIDTWTYPPPSAQPPSVADIIAANPTCWARQGRWRPSSKPCPR